MNKAKEILAEKFNGFLTELGVKNLDSVSFIIIPTNEIENYNAWDDMFRFWSTPTFTGIRMNYTEVINSLAKEEKNTIPLWIKVTLKKEMPIVLEISQRFRKPKVIFSRNPENKYSPFEVDNKKEIELVVNAERSEAVRILMFNRASNEKIQAIIGSEIHINEVNQNLEKHLNNYRFYPPLPNHQNVEDKNYSDLVINQDYKTGKFSVCNAENLKDEIQSNLNMVEAIDYYISNKIKDEFCGIRIKH